MRKNTQKTAVNLKKLEKKLILATRGHELLKEKQDSLIREFMGYTQKTTVARRKMNHHYSQFKVSYNQASLWFSSEELQNHLQVSSGQVKTRRELKNILGLSVPVFHMEETIEPMTTTNELLFEVIQHNKGLLQEMVAYTNLEKTCLILGEEIRSIRRRVNALEYRTIPSLNADIKAIKLKLDDQDRSEKARIMKRLQD